MRLSGSKNLDGLLGTIGSMLLAGMITACAPVQPWERGRLAQPGMALTPDPLLAAMNEHVYASKEAASGGIEAAGGGCGCN